VRYTNYHKMCPRMDIVTNSSPTHGEGAKSWRSEGFARVPYWVFKSPAVYAREQTAIFQGKSWNYLCLEAELPAVGDYVATYAGDSPVIVTRAEDGFIYAFENRCSHRGALLALEDRGSVKNFTCIYHAWTHSLQGDLIGVAFKDGVGGKGGMDPSFCMAAHGPRKLRVAQVHGLVFGSFSNDVPTIEEYIGSDVLAHISRVLSHKEPVIIGRFTQMLPNNWKLYFENVKDSYHASILHLFFTTFEINRLSQKGAIVVSEDGGNHVSYSAIDPSAALATEYAQQNIRSESNFGLADPSLLQGIDEFGDGITLQILSVFPGFVLQQIQNAIAIRQILPRGPECTELKWTYLGFSSDNRDLRKIRLRQSNLVGPAGYVSMEDGCVGGFVQRGIAGTTDHSSIIEMGGHTAQSSDSRVTETAIRGFWKAYRRETGL
jgi:anthranilate 1,2-dioxygenase large subunit